MQHCIVSDYIYVDWQKQVAFLYDSQMYEGNFLHQRDDKISPLVIYEMKLPQIALNCITP